MGTPELLSASLNSLTGSDNATGSIYVKFSEAMATSSVVEPTNYNFSPSLTITDRVNPLIPEVWFKMNEGAGTSITSSNGLYSGSFQAGSTALTWESGSYSTGSYSLFFDQYYDYVTPPNAIWPTSSDDMVTVAFWARMRGDVADDVDTTEFFEALDSSGRRVFLTHFPWSDGIVYWDCGYTGPSAYNADRLTYDWGASSNDDSTQWHHWAFTKKISTGQMRIYLDGTDVANSTGNTAAITNVNSSKIGGSAGGSYLWSGNVSDFAIWDVELSASDVATLYNDGSGSKPSAISSSNLTVLYPFQEGAGSTCYDKSGNSRDGTITNSHWALADPTPQPRTFVKFPDDVGSYIQCDHNPNFGTGSSPGPMSVAAWVRFNNNPVNYDTVVAATSDWGDGWMMMWVSSQFRFAIEHYATNFAYYSCDVDCSVKQWNHIVGTWDNSTIKIYVNGVKGTDDAYSGDMEFNNSPLRIGGPPTGIYSTDATIDNVKIYPGKALTQAEVTTLYNERKDFSPDPILWDSDNNIAKINTTGLNTSQGYILDVNNNIVSSVGGNTCVPNSASFIGIPSAGRSPNTDYLKFSAQGDGDDRTRIISRKSPGVISNLSAEADRTITITTPGTLTVKYFQRVWDIDNSQWCYYTQTAINASPGTTDTQPNNSGNIISSSVVQILEIY